MAELKTKPTDQSVAELLSSIPDEKRRQECRTVAQLMEAATGAEPKLWGSSIVGFGGYHYKCASGRSGDRFVEHIVKTNSVQ